jgi:hypothetical protein
MTPARRWPRSAPRKPGRASAAAEPGALRAFVARIDAHDDTGL